MSLAKKVFRNSLWLGGAQVGSRALSLVIAMILTRYLGARDFGVYSLVYAFCGIFGVLTNIGIDTIVVREASRDLKKAEILAGNGILLKAGLALVTVVLAALTARATGLPAGTAGLVMLASLSFLLMPLSLYSAVFPATLNLRVPALLEVAERTLSFLCVLLAVRLGGSLVTIVGLLLATAACHSALVVHFGRRRFRPRFRIDWSLWRNLAREVLPLALTNLLLTLILRIDQIMLPWLRPDGDLQLGLYAAAVKYCEVFNYLPAIFFASVFPLLSRRSERGDETFRNLYTLSFKYLSLAILPVALFSTLGAARIMSLLFGPDFPGAARPMQLLIWSEPFVFMAWVLVNTSVSSGSQRHLLPPALGAVAANIGLNVMLIPSHGAGGAALASLLSYALVVPLSGLMPRLRPLCLAFLRSALRPGLAVLLLWGLLSRIQPGLLLSALAVAAGFFLLMVLSGGLNREDWALARRVLAREETTTT